MDPETRIADLEEKLRKAVESEELHRQTEAGLRDALAYAESIVDTVREPLLVLDGELLVKSASRAFFEKFGVCREETADQFLYSLGNGQWDIPVLRAVLGEVLANGRSFQDFEVVHDFPGLGRRVMRLNARKIRREGNNTARLLLAIEDNTERTRLQDELLRSNEDLRRFAYVAAHDLRSPLDGALNLLGLFKGSLEGRLAENESQMLDLSIENMERLAALMQDILAFAEMTQVPRQKNPVALENSLQIALANLAHHIEKNQADIRVGKLPEVLCDRMQLAMLFQNLIGNAIKYRSSEPPLIRIDAAVEDHQWRVSVGDNGEGFEAKYAAEIFEPFTRLQGSKVPGSGIGLATCRRIVERAGGRIWADSQPGVGSTFCFTLTMEQ